MRKFSPTIQLFQKWAYRVPKGWYGFDLGDAPSSWFKPIDNLLSEIELLAPNFEIHQIKLKFTYLCIYLKLNTGFPELDKKLHEKITKTESDVALLYPYKQC